MKHAWILVFLLSAGCAHPVTSRHWQACEAACTEHNGIKEACVETFRGAGCHCNDEQIIWLKD